MTGRQQIAAHGNYDAKYRSNNGGDDTGKTNKK
jgi:hypothetical protein